MANNINWGKIYEKTYWGIGVITNTISWGKIYSSIAGLLPSFGLNFNTIATDFTFTRSSFATRVNEFGLIETVTNLGSDLVGNGSFDELGSELVTNGDFENGDTDWTIGSGWSTSVGKLTHSSGGGSDISYQELTGITSGKTYILKYNISGRTSGQFDLRMNSTILDDNVQVNGDRVITFISNGNNRLIFAPTSVFDGSIDNVSVQKVDPNDDWIVGSAWDISDGIATADGSASGGDLQQIGVVPSGTSGTYKFEWTQEITSGTRFRIIARNGNNSSGAGVTFVSGSTTGSGSFISGNCTGSGTFTVEVETTDGFTIWFLSESGVTGTIDNVSVQQVIEDDVPRIDYTGSTFDVPVLGDELVTNGSFDTDTNWTKQSGWSIANGVATFDINDYVSGNTNIYQNCMVSGKEYVLTFDIVDYVQGTILLASMNGSPNWSGNGTKTIKFISNNPNLFFNASDTNNTILSIDNISVKEVTAYTTTDKGAFLLEPQSTNLITYSEDFNDISWLKTGSPTITPNYGTSPDGTQNSTRIQGDSSTMIRTNAMTGALNGETRSIYVRATSGSGDIQLTSHNSNTNNIFSINETWQRVQTNSLTSSSGNTDFYIDMRGASTNIYDIEVWGAQGEALSYATSYIPTNGAIATRSAESCVDATPTINSEEGVLYAEISSLVDNQDLRVISLNDGTTGNIVQLYYSGSGNKIICETKVASSTQSSIRYVASSQTDIHKVAFKYKENDFALWVDGVEIDTNLVGSVWAEGTLTELDFNIGSSSLPFYGNTKDLKIYTKALTDDQLAKLTTI